MIKTEKQRQLVAARLRRALYWMKKSPDCAEMQICIQASIIGQIWRDWGYQRLYDCLVEEFRVDADQAVKLTRNAIIEGYEDGKVYEIEPGEHTAAGAPGDE